MKLKLTLLLFVTLLALPVAANRVVNRGTAAPPASASGSLTLLGTDTLTLLGTDTLVLSPGLNTLTMVDPGSSLVMVDAGSILYLP